MKCHAENAEAARFMLGRLLAVVLLCLLARYLIVTASSVISIAVAPSEPMEPN
jgi:hypothetical protein